MPGLRLGPLLAGLVIQVVIPMAIAVVAMTVVLYVLS